MVGTYICYCSNPITVFGERFIQNLDKAAVEAGVNFNIRRKFKNLEINDVQSISVADIQKSDNTKTKAIIIQRDINNVTSLIPKSIDSRTLQECFKEFSRDFSESAIYKLMK